MASCNLINIMVSNGVTGSILKKYLHIVGSEEYECVEGDLGDCGDNTWYVINDWVNKCDDGDCYSWIKVMEEELSEGDTEIGYFIYDVKCSLNNAVNTFQNIWRTKRAVVQCM